SAIKPEMNPGRSIATDLQPSSQPMPGRPWPSWAVWLVSGVLLFHLTALLSCELAGQVLSSPLESQIGSKFWWYLGLLHHEIARSYFAPEPDPATPVVTARLEFAGNRPDRTIRLPDPAIRPRIRYLRQIALAWHLVHEWSQKGPAPRSYWAESYARH